MTYIPDLAPFTELGQEYARRSVAIGWLDARYPYSKGAVDGKVVTKFAELFIRPWQPAVAGGLHRCEYCRLTGGPT